MKKYFINYSMQKKKMANYTTYQSTKINKVIPRYVYVTCGCSLGMCSINKGEPASRIKCLVKPYLSDARVVQSYF